MTRGQSPPALPNSPIPDRAYPAIRTPHLPLKRRMLFRVSLVRKVDRARPAIRTPRLPLKRRTLFRVSLARKVVEMLGIEPRASRSRSARYTKLSYISLVAVDGFEPSPVRLMRPLPYQLGDTAWCVERDLNSQWRRRRSAFTAHVLHRLHIHTLVGEERLERSCPCERQVLSLLGLPNSPIRRDVWLPGLDSNQHPTR